MVKIFSFDIDDTLEVSNGPVSLASMMQLRVDGHIVGLCGNFIPLIRVPGWHHLISFWNSFAPSKEAYLGQLKQWIQADEYIHVGNIGPIDAQVYNLKQTGGSNDKTAAALAGWRFIQEIDFANGQR